MENEDEEKKLCGYAQLEIVKEKMDCNARKGNREEIKKKEYKSMRWLDEVAFLVHGQSTIKRNYLHLNLLWKQKE